MLVVIWQLLALHLPSGKLLTRKPPQYVKPGVHNVAEAVWDNKAARASKIKDDLAMAKV